MHHNTPTIKCVTFSSLQWGIVILWHSSTTSQIYPQVNVITVIIFQKKDVENNDVDKGDGGDGIGRCGGVDWGDCDGDNQSNDNEESCGDDERGEGVDECPDGSVLLVEDGVDGDSGGRGRGGGAPVAARIKKI